GFEDVTLNATGNLAVLTMSYGGTYALWMVDLTNPAFARVVGTYTLPANPFAVTLDSTGTVAYVADAAQGLKILDISNPAVPRLLGNLAMAGQQVDIGLSGTTAVTVSTTGSLFTIDVSNPRAPVLKSIKPLSSYGSRVAVDGAT